MESVARHLSVPISAVTTPFALSDADALASLYTTAGFSKVDIVPESITARFPEPERFVPLTVISAAVAMPVFAQLQAPERAALVDAVRVEVEPIIRKYSDANTVTFPLFAHIVVATT